MVLGKFALLAHIHQSELSTGIYLLLHFIGVGLAHARLRVVHNLQKARRMLLGHEISFPVESTINIVPSCEICCMLFEDKCLDSLAKLRVLRGSLICRLA